MKHKKIQKLIFSEHNFRKKKIQLLFHYLDVFIRKGVTMYVYLCVFIYTQNTYTITIMSK